MCRLPRFAAAGVMCLASAACGVPSSLPSGGAAYSVISSQAPAQQSGDYLLRPSDTVGVSVFLEPELSVDATQIDPAGNIALPLIGPVRAAGKSPAELSRFLEGVLSRYVVQPQVTVTVTPTDRTFVVEGAVNRPGIYPVAGRLTLIGALALGGSPSQYADSDEIFVLREVNGQQAGARFDIDRIRSGTDPDPVILPGDRVVVSASGLKEAMRDYLSAPIFNIFRLF